MCHSSIYIFEFSVLLCHHLNMSFSQSEFLASGILLSAINEILKDDLSLRAVPGRLLFRKWLL